MKNEHPEQKHYTVMSAGTTEDLMEKVEQLIFFGWECVGGINSNVISGQLEYLQALIKKKQGGKNDKGI